MLNYKFIADYSINGIKNTTIKEVKDFLDSVDEFCIDIETTGLCPHRSKIIMLQVGNKSAQYIIDARCVDIRFIIPYLTGKKNKIGTNLKFEYKMFLGNLNCRMQSFTDIMINEMVLKCGLQRRGFSLAAMTKKYLDIHLPKDVRGEFSRMKDAAFEERHVRYGAGDVYYPQVINDMQRKKLIHDELITCVNMENTAVKVMAEMEFNGLPVDADRWLDIAHQNSSQADTLYRKLDSYMIDNDYRDWISAPTLFDNKPRCLVNWNSPKEVAKAFSSMGIPTKVLDKELTKKAAREYGIERDFYKDSVGGPELKQYADKFEIIPMFLDYQKYNKASSTFGEDWLNDNINPITGRVHTSFWQILNTGRSSSSSPNVQQIPCYKSNKFQPTYQAHRTCFVAPEGYKFVVRDYSGQELRILAEMSNEDAMIEEFVNGKGDLHSLTATKVYGVEVKKHKNPELRQDAKMLNFAMSYGAGAYKIAKALNKSQEEAQGIIDSYYNAFPKLENYFKGGHRFVRANGYVVIDPLTKRRSYFPFYEKYLKLHEVVEDFKRKQRRDRSLKLDKQIWSDYYTYKGIMERASQNYRIQGLAASMTKIALIYFYNHLLENDLFDDVEINLVLHDELVVMAKEELAEEIDKVLTDCMMKAGKHFCKRIPMQVSGGPCKVWDH
jgi:DNA polymerase-1